MKKQILTTLAGASLLLAPGAHAANVTWSGGNYTWVQPDSDSFTPAYASGDNVTFTNTGITDGTTGKTAIVLSGTLTPGDMTFNQTGARTGGAGGSSGAVGFNYLFTQAGTSNVINSTGNLTLNGGNTIFRALTTSGTYSNTFSGALNYSGGVMLGISSDNAARIATVQVGSLAAPTAGNSVLFNAITSANGNSSGANWSASTNRLIVTGSKPTVTHGMVSAGLQFYTGANIVGDFMTFSGNDLIRADANYTNYAVDWAAAGSTEIVNLTTGVTLSGSGDMNIHALRVAAGSQNLGGRTVNLGSGGLITTSVTISNGTLNFGSGPGYIGAYNAGSQGEISAQINGSGGLTIMGASQGLRLTNNSNAFTGGLFINGGSVVLGASSASTTGATAANGNNVTVNDLGSLAVNVTGASGATIGGLSGNGDVAPQYQQTAGSGDRAITISPASGTHTFEGTIRNGAGGSVLSVVKSGNGVQVFGSSSNASFTGTTSVSAGTLLVNTTFGGSGAGAVTVSGGTLGGNGTITGATTIQSGGTLAPGNSPDVLTFANGLTLEGATNMELNGTTRGTQYDGIDLTGGSLVYGGTMSLTFGSAFLASNTTFDLFNFSVSQSGTFTSIASSSVYNFTLNSGNSYSAADQLGNTWSFNHSTGDLSFSAIPEPTTWALLAGSLTALVIFRRRRRC